jgi:phosphotransferase system  glucose/maltose/N-acetylglucosamine-specific IIC component
MHTLMYMRLYFIPLSPPPPPHTIYVCLGIGFDSWWQRQFTPQVARAFGNSRNVPVSVSFIIIIVIIIIIIIIIIINIATSSFIQL